MNALAEFVEEFFSAPVLRIIWIDDFAPFDDPDFVWKLKHDGFRALAYIEDGRCRLISRKQIQYKSFAGLSGAVSLRLSVARIVKALSASTGMGRMVRRFHGSRIRVGAIGVMREACSNYPCCLAGQQAHVIGFAAIMTAEKLLGVLKLIESVDSKLTLQGTLDSIKDALSNLASSPAQPQFQGSLATALQTFEEASAKLREMITPAQALAIKELGGAEFFDPGIADKIKTSVQTNAMTPSVARDFVQDIATRRATFLKTVAGARQSLEKLGIKESTLAPGSADIAFLIPRDIFDNHLDQFAKELGFISRLVKTSLRPRPRRLSLLNLNSYHRLRQPFPC